MISIEVFIGFLVFLMLIPIIKIILESLSPEREVFRIREEKVSCNKSKFIPYSVVYYDFKFLPPNYRFNRNEDQEYSTLEGAQKAIENYKCVYNTKDKIHNYE